MGEENFERDREAVDLEKLFCLSMIFRGGKNLSTIGRFASFGAEILLASRSGGEFKKFWRD